MVKMRLFVTVLSLVLLAVLSGCTPKLTTPLMRDWEVNRDIITFTEDSTVLINGDTSGVFSMDTSNGITISIDHKDPVIYNYVLSKPYLFLDMVNPSEESDRETNSQKSTVYVMHDDSLSFNSDSTNEFLGSAWNNGIEQLHFKESTQLIINSDSSANYYIISADSLLIVSDHFSELFLFSIENEMLSLTGANDGVQRIFLSDESTKTDAIVDSSALGIWLNHGKNQLVLNSDFTAEAHIIDTVTNEKLTNKSGSFQFHSPTTIEMCLQGRSVLYNYSIEDSTLFLSKMSNLQYQERVNRFHFDKMEEPNEPTFVDSILENLTLEEKIGQMIIVYHAPLSFLKQYNIGGTLIMRNMIANEAAFSKSIKEIQEEMTIPIITSIDQEGGKVNRLVRKPQFTDAPSAEILSDWSYDESYNYHQIVAAKLTELGINLNLAPVLDPELNSRSHPTFMKEEGRSFTESGDSALTAFIKAFTDVNIGTTAKHFPGYDAAVNSDHHIAISDADSLQLERYLLKFRQYKNQYQAIMMSSILYTDISDLPAVFSKPMVDLAKSVDSTAVIVTDDLWGAAVRAYVYDGPNMSNSTYPDTAFAKVVTLAFEAGNDMLMVTFPQKVPLMIETIKESVMKDESFEEEIDKSVRRILELKLELGLFENGSDVE